MSMYELSRRCLLAGLAGMPLLSAPRARAGAADVIKIGNTVAYSGPASAYSVLGKLPAAYFRMVNDRGGINGRPISFLSYDDGYSPARTVEQTRRLVEDDDVLLIFNSLGAPTNTAIMKYMNIRKVPQLFVASGATRFGDPSAFPWTMGFIPSYQSEGQAFARHIMASRPEAKIGVIYQNDDFGRDVLKGLRDGLGARASMIAAQRSYESTDPVVDGQVVALHAARCDVVVSVSTPKFAAQTIRKMAELGWMPPHYLCNSANSVGAVLRPAGFENCRTVISSAYLKDANDAAWKDDPAFAAWHRFLDGYYPEGDRKDSLTVYSYVVSELLVDVLQRCGNDLTRTNVMKQAASLRGLTHGLLLPGISVTTGPNDYFPVEQLQMIRFDGERYVRFGDVIDVSGT